jgi:hypothetical protein
MWHSTNPSVLVITCVFHGTGEILVAGGIDNFGLKNYSPRRLSWFMLEFFTCNVGLEIFCTIMIMLMLTLQVEYIYLWQGWRPWTDCLHSFPQNLAGANHHSYLSYGALYSFLIKTSCIASTSRSYDGEYSMVTVELDQEIKEVDWDITLKSYEKWKANTIERHSYEVSGIQIMQTFVIEEWDTVRDYYKTNNNLAPTEANKIKILREFHKANINVAHPEAINCLHYHKTALLDSKNDLWSMAMFVFSIA